jgi:hypothetical protein
MFLLQVGAGKMGLEFDKIGAWWARARPAAARSHDMHAQYVAFFADVSGSRDTIFDMPPPAHDQIDQYAASHPPLPPPPSTVEPPV